MWNALADSMKGAYAAGLAEGAVPRPVIMPLVRGRLVGLIWVRPTKSGEDALTGIAQLSNIAAAAGADEIVLAWESRDVATACELPLSGPAPCLNMVHATRDGHVLHQFPYEERVLARDSEGVASIDPDWLTAPEPQPGGELVPRSAPRSTTPSSRWSWTTPTRSASPSSSWRRTVTRCA